MESILKMIETQIAMLSHVKFILTGVSVPKTKRKYNRTAKRRMSPAARARIVAAQKKRWAAHNKEKRAEKNRAKRVKAVLGK